MKPKAIMQLGLFLLIIGLAARAVIAVLPGMILIIIGGISHYWDKSIMRRIDVKIGLESRRAFPGEEIRGIIELINDQPFPLPQLRLFLNWPPNLKFPFGKDIALLKESTKFEIVQSYNMRWFEKIKKSFSISCTHRGEYFLGPIKLRGADFFGFTEAFREYNVVERLIVYPKQLPLQWDKTIANSPFGVRAFASWLYEDPLLMRGVRDYMPHDPFSKIEWKATAKVGKLQTKQLDASFATEIGLIVDVACSEKQWDIDHELLEKTILVAASILKEIQIKKLSFALHTNGLIRGYSVPTSVGVGSGVKHYQLCLETLGRLLPTYRAKGEELLYKSSKIMGQNAHLWLISGRFSPQLQQEIRSQLQKKRSLTIIYTGPKAKLFLDYDLSGYRVREEEKADEMECITLCPLGS